MVRRSFASLLLLIPSLIPSSTGLPFVETDPLSIHQDASNTSNPMDCNDLSWNLRPDCWNALNIPLWLTEWWNTNVETCEAHNASFASCFQQMAGVQQQQCDTIGPGLCAFPTNLTAFSPQQAYVLYSIFGIWQWFFSIYQGIGNANLGASGPVGKIVEAINPVKPSTQTLGEIFQAFTALTPLFKAPALVGRLSNTIETALRQSPGMLKQLFPSGTLNSQFVQVNEIYDGLSKIQRYYQSNITTILNMIESSFPTFLAFASDGGFIAPQSSLQAQTNDMVMALQTYIIASCLSQNDIIITLARDTDPHALATNGSLTTPSLVSCDYYDEHGLCSAWWHDPTTNRAFGLSSIADPQKNYYDLMQDIFNNGWTTPTLLFNGALECAEYVKNTGKNNEPLLDLTTLEPRCLSNTQICVYDPSCTVGDEGCEFTGEYGGAELCKPGKDYMGNCGETYSTYSARIPASYLGPMLTTTRVDMTICND
ncbi:MAG: hypothetical protein Q9219_002373 [cf. Caloplaca sp. 3 TL-2023]